MIEENLARLRAHRNNIRRYKRLLKTQLSDLERAFIAKRLRKNRVRPKLSSKRHFPSVCRHLGNR